MSDPNHPIFKQFTELDPSMIVIRDTPHPDWVWNQPPIMGTLTPGYARRNGGEEPRTPSTGDPKAQVRPQRWQPDFPGLWDDIPASGTSSTNTSPTSSNMSHTRPYPLPRSSPDMPPLSMGHSERLAGSGNRSTECQGRPVYSTGNRRIGESKDHRL
ncbi:unnamed protein product [Rhizoctonia solani]|uniref:Uncharacterized protein n=1 Tax=Rhizoctonia solani TaxID=456999 RepID=A0A8H3C6V9_9AGAM|nr:unnamed protein product [Rhizoctonia solani]